MASAREKFHIQARRAERKVPAAGSCSRFWKGAGRRAAALLLVTALALGMVGTALAQEVDPLQVTELAEFPTIAIETNLVMNEASGLPDTIGTDDQKYGFIEVALRVTPGSSGLFSGVAVALTYDQTLLTPVTWNEFDEATQKRDKYEVVTVADPAVPYSTFLPTKKADVISSASAFIGGMDDGKALLYLSAEAETPTKLTGDSRLAVVRFRYDATAHPLRYDGGDGGSNQIMDGATPVEFLDWAGDASAAASPAGANAYFTGKNEPTQRESMYYVHAAPNPGDAAKWPVHTTEKIAKPDTACLQLVKAVKATGTAADPDYYSYATNFFPVDPDYIAAINDGTVTTFPTPDPLTPLTPKIQFTQITAAPAAPGSGGISLDDIVTVVFFDWDDTFLGATAVARGLDARETVNDFVKESFVHPDIVKSNYTENQLKTMERQYTYRGKYEHIAPNSGNAVADGGEYLLTNHVDYAFYMTFDDEFFYDDGWVKVTPQTLETTWTTLGADELFGVNEIVCFDFMDDMQSLSGGEKTIYVKAAYSPGPMLDTGEDAYTITDEPKFSSFGGATGEQGYYSISFTIERVNGGGFGVSRIQEPTLSTEFLPDITGATSYFSQTELSGADVLNAVITPSKSIRSVDYQLKNAYGSNFMSGSEKSAKSYYGTFYNYETVTATDGFVRRGTQEYILEQFAKEIRGDATSQFYTISIYEYIDAGFQSDSYDVLQEWEDVTFGQGATLVGVATNPNLTVYQIQYAIATWACEENAAEAERWYWEDFWPNTTYGTQMIEPFEKVTYAH